MSEDLSSLQERIRSELGRELSLEEVARNQGRLQRALAISEGLAEWEKQLDLIEPATVSVLVGRRSI